MNRVTDLDFDNRNTWQGALKMLLALCGESADLSFDFRTVGDLRLPTVELRLDNPAELTLPEVLLWEEASAEVWSNGTVIMADRKPEKMPDGPVWLLRHRGTAAVTYRAFREAVRVLAALSLPAEFSWSSIPLAPVCDDLELTLRREADSYAFCAIHTVWLRCPRDETLKSAMGALGRCGQLRVQNMATANTWIVGETAESRLLDAFRNPR